VPDCWAFGKRNHSFRSASLNGIVRSTLPVEPRTRISPERKHARPLASFALLECSNCRALSKKSKNFLDFLRGFLAN